MAISEFKNGKWVEIGEFNYFSGGHWRTAKEVSALVNGKWNVVWPTEEVFIITSKLRSLNLEEYLSSRATANRDIVVICRAEIAAIGHMQYGMFSGNLSRYKSVTVDIEKYIASKGGDGGGGHKNNYETWGSRGRPGGPAIVNVASNLSIIGSGMAIGGGGGGGGGGSSSTRGRPGGGGAGDSVGKGNSGGAGGTSGDGTLLTGGHGVSSSSRGGGDGGDAGRDGEAGDRGGYGGGGKGGAWILGLKPSSSNVGKVYGINDSIDLGYIYFIGAFDYSTYNDNEYTGGYYGDENSDGSVSKIYGTRPTKIYVTSSWNSTTYALKVIRRRPNKGGRDEIIFGLLDQSLTVNITPRFINQPTSWGNAYEYIFITKGGVFSYHIRNEDYFVRGYAGKSVIHFKQDSRYVYETIHDKCTLIVRRSNMSNRDLLKQGRILSIRPM